MKRLLFVDDEQNVLDGIRRMLYPQRHRWEVHFAYSGDSALQMIQELHFNVVVSDMRMPGMDGATLLGHVRELSPETARLVLSGYSDITLATRAASTAHRVLSKPCTRETLLASIDSLCTLQELFCTTQIRKIVGTIGELPSLPGNYDVLLAAMKESDASIRVATNIIYKDTAMSAKVLQLVNSGFFGLAHPCTSLKSAVEYLGMKALKDLVLTSEAFRLSLPDNCFPISLCGNLQRHSHRTALIVDSLPMEQGTRNLALLSALLHDIGGLVLAYKMPDQLRLILDLVAQSNYPRCQAEIRVLGTSQAEVGAYLLGLWGLHESVLEAVAKDQHPTCISNVGLNIRAAIYLANLLAHELETHSGDDDESRPADRDCATLGGLELLQRYSAFRACAV